jgi:hypothetical protein
LSAADHSARAVQLTFFGDPLKGFVGALDAVLMLVTIRRQKFHDLIGPISRHVAERLRREIDRLAEPKLVCVCVQRWSPETLLNDTPNTSLTLFITGKYSSDFGKSGKKSAAIMRCLQPSHAF